MFLTDAIEVRKTKRKGRGVFANREIPGGTIVADYIGIIIESEDLKEQEHGMVYDMWYSDLADISPDPNTPGMHYINYSCEPTCGIVAEGRHTLLYAQRTIFPDEELTYDYFIGEQDDDELSQENCRCGSDFCRGTMYTPEKLYDAWDAYITPIVDPVPHEPPVPYGELLPPLDRYPTEAPDNPLFCIYGTKQRAPYKCNDTSVLKDLSALRHLIRTTGKQIAFPELGIVVEGVLPFGHIALKPMKK